MASQMLAKPCLPLRLSSCSSRLPTVVIASTPITSLPFIVPSLPLTASLAESTRSWPILPRFNGVLLSLAASVAIFLSPPPEATFASAATIKMGADEGSLVFVPSSISVPAGEKIIFLNNKGFPHNVIFEKNGVPEGVQVEVISHEDYMNEQGEQFVITLKEKGTYTFFCEPHRAAGMFGEITVT